MAPNLAVVAPHPVHYRTPIWKKLTNRQDVDITVFYASRFGLNDTYHPDYKTSVSWGVSVTSGYRHEFLKSIKIPILPGRTSAQMFPLGLTQRLLDGNFDAVLVFGYISGAAIAGLKAAKRLHLPVAMRAESHDVGRNFAEWKQRIKLPIERRIFRTLDIVLPIGTWNYKYWIKREVSPDHTQTVLYGVDNQFFREQIERHPKRVQELRKNWGANKDDVVFLYCARLAHVKNPQLLFRALSSLSQKNGVHLVIAGAGPLEVELRKLEDELALQNVHWLGFTSQPDLPFVYAAADVFVLPSRFEPWGLVVNEAMACGTPCIVSSVVGSGPDLVAEPNTGIVFESENVDALKNALEFALDSTTRNKWKSRINDALAHAEPNLIVDALADWTKQAALKRDR